MYTPHTVTVYYTGGPDIHITVLKGVFCDTGKAAAVSGRGLEPSDAATVFIPFAVEAADGVAGGSRVYAQPKAFQAAADKSGLWSLGLGEKWFFIKGEAVEPGLTFQTACARYDDVYRIARVETRDFGAAAMQHWEVGGA